MRHRDAKRRDRLATTAQDRRNDAAATIVELFLHTLGLAGVADMGERRASKPQKWIPLLLETL